MISKQLVYILLNTGVLFFPFILSFDKKVHFYKNWKHLFPAIFLVGAVYVAWDIWASSAGHWGFNPEFVASLRLGHLPPGEFLFFITVPYACLFIYECVKAYFPNRKLPIPRWVFFIPVPPLTAAVIWGGILNGQGYTMAVCLAGILFFLAAGTIGFQLFRQSASLLYLLIALVPFGLANGILTSLPVVTYGGMEFSGIRIVTIPLEDFLYNITLLGFELLVYHRLKFRRKIYG